jgi:arginine repressor
LAGDDTAFVALKSEADAQNFLDMVTQMLA